jgi:hypothetical protein
MHTGNHHNAIAFYFEEKTVRKAFYARAGDFRLQHLEGEGTSRDDLYNGIHRQSKPHAKVRVNAFRPGERFPQVCIRFGYPDDRQRHYFLNRAAALTCSQGMTSSGLAHAIVQFIALSVRQRQFIRFQALPQRIEQIKLFRRRKVSDFIS